MKYFKTKRKCWDIIKKYYPIYESKRPVIESLIRFYLKRHIILLDVGSGRGKETPICYKNEVNMSVGIDISEAVIFNNTIHYPMRADACSLPFADSSIDLIVSQELIEHLERPDIFFNEVCRILKPGGVFIFATPNLLSWKSLISLITPYSLHKKLNKQLHDIDEKDVFPTYYKMNKVSKVDKFMKKNGMSLEKIIMWEGTPRTLTFSQLTTYFDIFISTILRKFKVCSNYRELIVASYKKN